MLKKVKGDVFEIGIKENAVIIHGANCFKIMGAGVANQVRKHFYPAYKSDLNDNRDPKEKLGSFSYYDFGDFIIANAYTQYKPGPNVNYDAIWSALSDIRDAFPGRTFVFPKIGSGIAGGDPKRIQKIMETVFKDEDAILVIWN